MSLKILRTCLKRFYNLNSINPSTGKVLKTFSGFSYSEIEKRLDELHSSYIEFNEMNISDRKEYLRKVIDKLSNSKTDYGSIMSLEMGKPLNQAVTEIEKCINLMEFYLEEGWNMLDEELEPYNVENSRIIYEPIGIIFQIAPFNYPFWQVIRFGFPTMIQGNVMILRHSRSCPENGLYLEELFNIEGYPTLLSNVFCNHENVSKIIKDDRVKGVAFTEAGRIIAEQSGLALKKSVMELGGSDPFIVFDDADIDLAVEKGCISRFLLNSGQSCNAAKRFILHSDIKDEFIEKCLEKIKTIKIGDPFESVDMGPLARKDLRDDLHVQVENAISDGAICLAGGNYPDNEGFFYNPTILDNCSPDTPTVWFEETFGPVMCITEFSDTEEAINLANNSKYGLSSCIFTKDIEKGNYIARKMETGMTYTNSSAFSHWALPFGGQKLSGYGRECGIEGIREFSNIKTLMTF